MTDFNTKCYKDQMVFDELILKTCILNTFWKRLWGAWKILCGEAGILLIKINPQNRICQKKE